MKKTSLGLKHVNPLPKRLIWKQIADAYESIPQRSSINSNRDLDIQPRWTIQAEFSLTSHPDFLPFHSQVIELISDLGEKFQGRTSHDINESEGKVMFFFCIEVLGRRTTSRPSWPWWRMKRWLQRMRWEACGGSAMTLCEPSLLLCYCKASFRRLRRRWNRFV